MIDENNLPESVKFALRLINGMLRSDEKTLTAANFVLQDYLETLINRDLTIRDSGGQFARGVHVAK